MKNRKEIYKESKRILKDKGKLLIADWQKGKTLIGSPEETRINKETLLKEAEVAGFKYIKDIKTDLSHYGFLVEKL